MNLENKKFPAGLRVLVVDDDTTCLRLIDCLLKKCNYHVRTTNQAREALRILKENKNWFDIVISDVKMPDIDGITLLQIVGLQMNLPVIMLSAYSDTKLVMQGIRNGACDYLVKPVRIQELQNIWQHVVRRNKFKSQRAIDYSTGGSAHLTSPNDNTTQDMKHKGKDIEENTGHDNDDDELEESGHKNEDPTTQKKPRFVWSAELHHMFVDAVNQLGLDKAYPKSIHELMNVEGLTREQVASHLQKYRIYLRKVNSGEIQQGKRLNVFEQEDANIGNLGEGYRVYRSLAGPHRFPSIGLARAKFGHLNTPSELNLKDRSSSSLLQIPHIVNPNNSFNTFEKFDSLGMSTNQNTNFFPATPKALLCNSPNTTIMLNGIQTLNENEHSNKSTPFSTSSPVRGLVMSGQSSSFTQNTLPIIGSINNIASSNKSFDNDSLDMFTSIPNLGTSHSNSFTQNQDSFCGFDHLNNIRNQQVWPNQSPNYIMNSCNISTTPSSKIPVSVAPIVVGENAKQNNNLMGASPFTQLEGSSSKNAHSKPNNASDLNFDGHYNSSESLEDIVGRFLK